MDKQSLCLLAGFVLSVGASAEQWFTVSSAEAAAPRSTVEIDLETVRVRDQGGEALVRLTHDTARSHSDGFVYRSFVATAQFDCQRRSISLVSAAYYSQPGGVGARLGADSAGKEAGMPPNLLDSVPPQARQALLKAMCATARTNWARAAMGRIICPTAAAPSAARAGIRRAGEICVPLVALRGKDADPLRVRRIRPRTCRGAWEAAFEAIGAWAFVLKLAMCWRQVVAAQTI